MAQQRNPFLPIKWGIYQGMTSDIDPLIRPSGIVDDALNIHTQTDGGYTTESVENVYGNISAYDLPTATVQVSRQYWLHGRGLTELPT